MAPDEEFESPAECQDCHAPCCQAFVPGMLFRPDQTRHQVREGFRDGVDGFGQETGSESYSFNPLRPIEWFKRPEGDVDSVRWLCSCDQLVGGMCRIYDNRPQLCRKYQPGGGLCPQHEPDPSQVRLYAEEPNEENP